MTGPRYTVEQKVDMYFESLRPRYHPFCMYQYCAWCGKDYPRTAFRFKWVNGHHTHIYCKYCKIVHGRSHKPRADPVPWESREMMLERLIKERGVSEDREGNFYVYQSTKEHRDAIRRGQGDLTEDGKERLRYKAERDRMAEIRLLSSLKEKKKGSPKEEELRKMLQEKWERERMK